jgi:hypothetical protein
MRCQTKEEAKLRGKKLHALERKGVCVAMENATRQAQEEQGGHGLSGKLEGREEDPEPAWQGGGEEQKGMGRCGVNF